MVDAYDYGSGGLSSDVATTTFGPLTKYVAANDNVPPIADGDWARHADATGFVPVARQPARPASADSGQFCGDNPYMEMTPEERLPQGLALLAARSGYIYLGSPYSKYEAGHDAAARVVADAAARLMRFGMVIYSPIAHGHAVTLAGGLPITWDFWKRQCRPLVDGAAGLIVLTMAGWQDSVGLQYEIEEFVRAGKPILHVSPRWLVENNVGRVG
ncbi:DUF1937 family protein [Shinella sp. BYT-45]|uniref:DUF1937 family protein n=1 Tax=Shinella sp. BYT-45 TaxID=3377377 RepID=UPI00397F8468